MTYQNGRRTFNSFNHRVWLHITSISYARHLKGKKKLTAHPTLNCVTKGMMNLKLLFLVTNHWYYSFCFLTNPSNTGYQVELH